MGLGSMSVLVAVMVACAATAVLAKDALPDGVQVVRRAAMDERIAGTPPSPGGRGGVMAKDESWRVHIAEREAPGMAEQHAADTDLWYVIAGQATLVTGGTLADATVVAPGEQRAPSIRGGTETAISAGDFVSIRPGVPHWVKAVEGPFRYLTVKVEARTESPTGGPGR
jgi:mannose-6-phosphate isomerase-like protein (cupin superfamily)